MKHHSASGQILVLVLLVVLVALTIGLSIASRTLSTLRNTAELDQSNRAFSAAEAGIERALALLKTNPTACDNTDCSASISGVEAKVDVSEAGGTTDAFGVANVDKDDVLQANLDGYSGSTLNLYWGSKGDNAGSTCPNASAVVVSIVYRNSGTGAYGLGKGAYDACLDAARASNNFDRSSVTVDPPNVLSLQDGSTQGEYGYKVSLNLAAGGPYVPVGNVPVMARVRLMYVGDKPVAFDPSGNMLPVQGQQIISTAVVGGKQRTVKVLKSTSSLPSIFDYALFNGSTSPLSK
jgi:Tfp pilus assembly protein PilX